MKILIAPAILNQKSDASYDLSANIANAFLHGGNTVALSAPAGVSISNVSLYTCNAPKKNILLSSRKIAPTYEEWLYKNGCLDESYLDDDLDQILDACISFKPDLLIAIERPMAEAAAHLLRIPCFTYVHPAMYRNRSFPVNMIYSVNRVLSDHHHIQIISLKDLMSADDLRFGFGPAQLMYFPDRYRIFRIGTQTEALAKTAHTNRVCIYLNDLKKSSRRMKQIILDAFHGAPYAVYASFHGSENETEENIHFLSRPKPELIPGSIAVIHDGNDYYCNICMAKGIVQVIVSNHDFIRLYNGQSVERSKTGRLLFEENFTMNTLYQSYRAVLSDDAFDINAQKIKDTITSGGNLGKLVQIAKDYDKNSF